MNSQGVAGLGRGGASAGGGFSRWLARDAVFDVMVGLCHEGPFWAALEKAVPGERRRR